MSIAAGGYSPPEVSPIILGEQKEKFLLDKGAATGSAFKWGGGRGLFRGHCDTWNSATLTLEFRHKSTGDWALVGGTALTADGTVEVDLPMGEVRAAVSGSPTDLTATLTITGSK